MLFIVPCKIQKLLSTFFDFWSIWQCCGVTDEETEAESDEMGHLTDVGSKVAELGAKYKDPALNRVFLLAHYVPSYVSLLKNNLK